jgi:hypothetical protein
VYSYTFLQGAVVVEIWVQNGDLGVLTPLKFTIAGGFPQQGKKLVRGVWYIIGVSIAAKIKFLISIKTPENWELLNFDCNLFLPVGPVPLFLRRRDGRAVECGGLENR